MWGYTSAPWWIYLTTPQTVNMMDFIPELMFCDPGDVRKVNVP